MEKKKKVTAKQQHSKVLPEWSTKELKNQQNKQSNKKNPPKPNKPK